MTPLQTSALSLLRKLVEREAAYDAVNRELRALEREFPVHLNAIDPALETAVVGLLDEILGDGLAGYFLWDCSRDGRIEVDGRSWPIRSVDDIARYIEGRP